MHRPRRLLALATLIVALAPAAAIAADPSPAPVPSAAPDRVDALKAAEQAAVAAVLARDPRYAGIADWTDLARESARTFLPHTLVASSYRVLPSAAFDLAVMDAEPRTPMSTLVAVTLVRDCLPVDALPSPLAADPCGWRHTWLYRVDPAGAVTRLFDEGDPDAG